MDLTKTCTSFKEYVCGERVHRSLSWISAHMNVLSRRGPYYSFHEVT